MKFRKNFFKKEKSTFKLLSQQLEKRRKDLFAEFSEQHKDTIQWLEEKGIDVEKALAKSAKGALVSLAAGLVMLSGGSGVDQSVPKVDYSAPDLEAVTLVSELTGKASVSPTLAVSLRKEIPKNTKVLNFETEKKLAETVSQIAGIKVTPELEGNRLNTSYGRIGLEQHLPRYSGEKMSDHLDNDPSEARYSRSGMTRNRGAFGYFASSRGNLTKEGIDQEKYYVVVQTFEIAGYKKNITWYKHRKVIVVNPENGRAVVGDIADSGPAKWTGKKFGGSPELMDHIGMYPGERKTPVLIFFVDDPTNSIKLGPL